MAIADSRVIGAAPSGWPRSLDAQNDTSFTLDGIAVDVQYQKRGLGGRLFYLNLKNCFRLWLYKGISWFCRWVC